jgi:hypothetical protein
VGGAHGSAFLFADLAGFTATKIANAGAPRRALSSARPRDPRADAVGSSR